MKIENAILPRSASANPCPRASHFLIEIEKAKLAFSIGVCRAAGAKLVAQLPQAPKFQ
jgi:hypothetical protein